MVKLADSRRQRMNRARTQGQGAMPQYWGMPGPGMPFPQLQVGVLFFFTAYCIDHMVK